MRILRILPATNIFLLQALILFFTGIFSYSGFAGTIEVTQKNTAIISENILAIETTIINNGSSPAYNLRPRVIVAGENVLLPALPALSAGSTYRQNTNIDIGNHSGFNLGMISVVEYQNENGRRYDNTNFLYLSTEDKPAQVSINISSESYSITENRYIIHIKNHTKDILNINLQTAYPDGIGTNFITKKINLPGLSEINLPVIVNAPNLRLYENSNIYAVISYSIDNFLFSQIISTKIFQQNNLLSMVFSSERIISTLSLLLLTSLLIVIIKNYIQRKNTN